MNAGAGLRLGLTGMFMVPERVMGKRPSHPDIDPLWATLQEANLVFAFGLGGTMQLIPALPSMVCDGLFDLA